METTTPITDGTTTLEELMADMLTLERTHQEVVAENTRLRVQHLRMLVLLRELDRQGHFKQPWASVEEYIRTGTWEGRPVVG